MNAVTAGRHPARRARFLRPDRLSVVLVGNAAAFASQLAGVGFGTYETIELDDLDLIAGDLKRAARGRGAPAPGVAGLARLAARATAYSRSCRSPSGSATAPDEIASAKALLDSVIEAKGGIDKLRA